MFKTFINGLNRKVLRCSNPCRSVYLTKAYSTHDGDDKKLDDSIPKGILSKYEAFREDRAPIILDVEEERRKLSKGVPLTEDESEEYNPFAGISPERGLEGVIELEELITILKRENAINIFVAEVPPEYRYVRYIVVVTGKSVRHMLGMAEFIRRVFKYKCQEEHIPMIEGKKSQDWVAIDLGNIALHIMSNRARELYDLESLWSVGKEFDKLCQEKDDPLNQLLNEFASDLSKLQPIEKN